MNILDKKRFLINCIIRMRREYENDYTPLQGEDYKMDNLLKEYNRLTCYDKYEI